MLQSVALCSPVPMVLLPMLFISSALAQAPSGSVRRFKFGMMLSGPPGDLTWNFRHNKGRLKTVDYLLARYPNLAVDSEFRVIQDRLDDQSDSVDAAIQKYGEEKWDLVLACSTGFQKSTIAAANRYPSTHWVSIAGYAEGPPNFGVAEIRVYQARYIGGIAAASQTKTGKVGMVSAHPIPAVVRGLNAFTLGVRSVDPSIKVYTPWVYSWHDEPRDALAAEWLIHLGVDALHAHTNDREIYSVFMDRGLSTVGYHTDLRELYNDRMVTSAFFDWENLYKSYADDILAGRRIQADSFVGMEAGAAAVGKPSQYVPLWARERMYAAEATLRSGADTHPVHGGSGVIFCGPLKDEYGYQVLHNKTDCSTIGGLRTMTWFAEGVEDLGGVPMPYEVCLEGNQYKWLPEGKYVTDNTRHFLGESAPGRRKLRWDFTCTPCRPGFISAVAGSTSCTPCGPGHYSPGTSATHNATECIPCPEGEFTATNSSQVCQKCPDGWFNRGTGNWECPFEVLTETWLVANWWVLIIILGGACLVIVPPLVFVFTRQSRRMRALYNNNRVAEECAESIAAMRLDEVGWIEDIPNPNKIQLAFVKIVSVLKQYKSYLPASLFAMQGDSDSEGDEQSPTGSGNDVDAAGVRKTQVQPRRPSGSVVGSAHSSGKSSKTVGDKNRGRAVPCGIDANLTRKLVAVLWAGTTGTHEHLKAKTSQIAATAFHHMVGAMLQAVEGNRGVLDHISGDRAMVAFGAARTGSNRLLSVRCALGIADGVKGAGGRPHVGAERGQAYVGTIGTDTTRKHTLMGRVVNIAYTCSRVARQHSIPVLAGHQLASETETEVQYWALCAVRSAKLGGAARCIVLSEIVSVRKAQGADEWMYQMADATDTDVHAEWNKRMVETAVRADQAIRGEEIDASNPQKTADPDREGFMKTLEQDGPVCSVPVDVAF
eukprot:TRINITY_DN614_c0_g1_i1.p1 TRINITY_DN614_c0_g1~~TRINITY_DN614_c0_g1_i1.p1  ORF type:complete len:939 (+),score=268.43 TRINITY_DN614_c0_g1_i1:37-2853(+)